MKKSMLHFVVVQLLVLIGLLGCRKDNPEPIPVVPPTPQREEWPMVYGFINNDTAQISAVVMLYYTYYPDSNFTNKIEYDSGSDKVVILTGDTIYPGRSGEYQPKKKVFKGCTKQIAVTVYKNWGDSIILSGRGWYFLKDTINTEQDRFEFFHWPEDTLKATRFK